MSKTKKDLLKYLNKIANAEDEFSTPARQFSAIKVLFRYDKQAMIEKLEQIVDTDSEKSIIAADMLIRILEDEKTPRMDINLDDKTAD